MSKPLECIPDNHDEELDDLEEDEATQQESESPDDLGPERRKIFTDKSDPPIGALYTRFEAGDLVLDPLFQRRKVWEDSRSSRLIESLILEVPLPVFYLAEGNDGKEEVIDGQQRLTAFFRFMHNDYSLKGLKALSKLNGKFFKDLDKPTQKLIREGSVRTILFKKESDDNLRFEIFERLNTGAVPLNQQELRNCVYRGPYNQLLISLAADKDYLWLMGLEGPEKRMKDVEYVLRFAAFHHATYLKYKPPMARFLNEDMRKFQKASDQEQEELRSAFKTAVTLVRSLMGQHAFRRFYRGTDKDRGGYWEPKQFNASLYDILMWSFAGKDKNQVMANLDAIREALIVLMTEDQSFIDAIELSTSSAKMVNKRFDAWRQALDAILNTSAKQPRTFSRALKQALYKADPTCAICKQGIGDLDDAAVDHVEQYWLGGKTIPKNARLAHRYCNWSRPRKEPATPKQQTLTSAVSQSISNDETNSTSESEGDQNRPERYDLRKRFWAGLLSRPKAKTTRHANITPGEYSWIAAGSGVRGLPFTYVIGQDHGKVELYIDRGADQTKANKRIFKRLLSKKNEIEKGFGGKLSWQRLDDKRACRIAHIIKVGGYKSDESKWPEIQDTMIDAMVRLEKALTPHLGKLKTELASEGKA